MFSKHKAKEQASRHLAIDRGPKGLVVSFDWSGKSRLAASLAFAIACTFFYVPFFGMIIFATNKVWLWNDFGHYLTFVSSIVALSFLAFAYVTLAFWLNRTIVIINRETLTIRHGPLPWRRPAPVNREAVEQLRIVAYESYSYGGDPDIKGDETPVHALCIKAALKNKLEVLLVNGLFDYVQAVQIEREIEAVLGIEDQEHHDSIQEFKYSSRR
ncbi:MAG TPA: hypothetical protein VFV50_14760 [Bdellovibrionales bacterium]|nr:hypothetical protein [Bdellovibrionales bacterium]